MTIFMAQSLLPLMMKGRPQRRPFIIPSCNDTSRNKQLRRKHARQVIVDHIDTDLLGALFGVVILDFTKVVDKERDIVTDTLVVGLEGLGIVILDCTAKVVVIQKR